jgi:hypothetical protein
VDTTFRQYKDAVLDQLGENKEQGIRDAVAQKQIEERPMTDSKVILMAGGDQLCLESLTGRYFKSTLESVRKAQNDLNERMLGGDYYASHDEFCELLGLGSTGFGTELGWNGANLVQLQFTAAVTDNGEAAIVIGYASMPRTNYTDF